MVSIDVLVPRDVVVNVGPDVILSPLSDQVIERGSSPLLTVQSNCAYSPSSRMSLPKDIGTSVGFSVEENTYYQYHTGIV